MTPFQIPFKKTVLAPALYKLGAKTYVVPGYIEVPNDTTLLDVFNQWIPWYVENYPDEPQKEEIKSIKETVVSSKGDKTYDVYFNNGSWWCDCVGFGYRNKCRHVTEVKEKYKIK
jgi:hypothetical protein